MFLFLSILFSLNVNFLDVNFKTMAIFNFKVQNVISYAYIKQILNLDETQLATYFSASKNLSEYYTICNPNKNTDNFEYRARISDIKNKFIQRNMSIKLSDICKYIEICPGLKNPVFIDNHIIVEFENKKKFSLYIWEKLFLNEHVLNKRSTIYNINLLLSKSENWLKENLSKFPLLYFKNNFAHIHQKFSSLLNLLNFSIKIDLKEFISPDFFGTEEYNHNQIMQRYHMIKGPEINESSLDFYVGCILTDISNIIEFFKKSGNCYFKIYNMINVENYLIGILYISFEFKIKNADILLDFENNKMLYIYDLNLVKIKDFIYRPYRENIIILIPKIYCLEKLITDVKISVYTLEGLFESKFLKIRDHVFN